jgi:hypothetical protein
MSDDPRPPWSSVADIGGLGIETAATVVERLLDLTREVGGLRVPLLEATTDTAHARRLRANAERLIDLYADWTRSLVDATVDVATPANGSGNGSHALVLGPVAPGEEAADTLWLHFLDGPAADRATFQATDLSAHHGGRIPADEVSFDPPTLDAGTPRSKQQVEVRVTVPSGAVAGPYHGHVLVEGFPEVCLGLRVDVS